VLSQTMRDTKSAIKRRQRFVVRVSSCNIARRCVCPTTMFLSRHYLTIGKACQKKHWPAHKTSMRWFAVSYDTTNYFQSARVDFSVRIGAIAGVLRRGYRHSRNLVLRVVKIWFHRELHCKTLSEMTTSALMTDT
jgi:hypothetical protein